MIESRSARSRKSGFQAADLPGIFSPFAITPTVKRSVTPYSAITILAAVFLGSTFALADSNVPNSYPLSKCVVSGEKLGEHGKPVKVTSEGTDVYFCCKSCIKDFNKDPKKFVKMVTDAAPKK